MKHARRTSRVAVFPCSQIGKVLDRPPKARSMWLQLPPHDAGRPLRTIQHTAVVQHKCGRRRVLARAGWANCCPLTDSVLRSDATLSNGS